MKMILFVSSGCPACPRGEKIAKRVSRDYAEKGLVFQKVRLKTKEGKVLADKFNIRTTPTIVLLDENGEETKRFVGVPEEEGLRDKVEQALGLRKSLIWKLLGK